MQRTHPQALDLALIGVDHLEFEVAYGGGFIADRHVPEGLNHQSAYGIEFLITEIAVEVLVEIIDGCECLDKEVVIADLADERIGGGICFVLDFADDFLQYILDGHQAGHTAIFIDYNGNVASFPFAGIPSGQQGSEE